MHKKYSSSKNKQKNNFVLRQKYHFKSLKTKLQFYKSLNKQNSEKQLHDIKKNHMKITQSNYNNKKQLLPNMDPNKQNNLNVTSRNKSKLQIANLFKKQAPFSVLQSKTNNIQRKVQKSQQKQTINQTQSNQSLKLQNPFNLINFNIKKYILEMKKKKQKQLYYISDVKNQLLKAFKGIDQPNIFLAHFYQSIATFHLFPKVNIPKQPCISINFNDEIALQKKKMPVLIFDMDETLLHCSQGKQGDEDLVSFQMQVGKAFLKCDIRPYAKQILERLSKKFEIGVFTAGRQPYAAAMLNYLDPQSKYFSFKLFRQHCHPFYHNQGSDPLNVKDLRIIKNRDIKKMILIDNSAHTYLFQPQNAIPIFSYYGNKQDQQLLKLQKFLDCPQLINSNDVRPFLKNYFRIHQYKKFRSAKQICDKLY